MTAFYFNNSTIIYNVKRAKKSDCLMIMIICSIVLSVYIKIKCQQKYKILTTENK